MPLSTEPGDRARLIVPALRSFVQLAGRWGLTPAQQATLLGAPSVPACVEWLSSDAQDVPPDTLLRLSYLFGIHKALRILMPTHAAECRWISHSNTAPGFGGRSALDRLLSGSLEDLAVVRRHLDAQLDGG